MARVVGASGNKTARLTETESERWHTKERQHTTKRERESRGRKRERE